MSLKPPDLFYLKQGICQYMVEKVFTGLLTSNGRARVVKTFTHILIEEETRPSGLEDALKSNSQYLRRRV